MWRFLCTARATAAFKFHLDLHLHKEETHLFPLFAERLSVEEQGQAASAVGQAVPGDRFDEFVTWLVSLVDDDDREKVVRIWQSVMPPGFFASTLAVVRGELGDEFTELTRRIPDLPDLSDVSDRPSG